mgnify:FL=1
MSKIFITGSSDGLGLLVAKALVAQDHEVFVHARNEDRANDLKAELPNASAVLIADLANIDEVKQLAKEVNSFGRFDAIIHNAGIFSGELFNVNVLAPYMLTAEIETPNRLIYLSSSMHKSGSMLKNEAEIPNISYSDSKFLLTLLMNYVAKIYPETYVNAVDPGWVPTKMGGQSAPDDLQKGYETKLWLATSEEDAAKVTGKYFFHQQQQKPHSEITNTDFQQKLITICKNRSGVDLE